MPGAGDLVSCSFCGKRREQGEVMIGGPSRVYICEQCVGRAHAAIAEPGPTAGTPAAVIQQVTAEAGTEECRFCGKLRDRVRAMASTGDVRICDECLDLCDEILSEIPPAPSR